MVWLTDERYLALFLVGTIARDPQAGYEPAQNPSSGFVIPNVSTSCESALIKRAYCNDDCQKSVFVLECCISCMYLQR